MQIASRIIILVFFLLLPSTVLAERQISVTGQGVVDMVPDMAVIQLGVVNEAPTAAAALSATNEAARAVLTRLTDMGIADRDLQTGSLSLNPVWNTQRGATNEPPRIVRFSASNTLSIRVRDLTDLGEILDAAVSDGANTLNGLRFDVENRRPLLDEARRLAVSDARARAELYAAAAGVGLGDVQSISETGARPGPMMMERAALASDVGVPIALGEISLSASVTMVFAIAN